jgi:hypothetical protein
MGRQTGIGGHHLHLAVRLEDRLHQRFAEVDSGDLAATLHTREMGLSSEGTTIATAPPGTAKVLLHDQLVHAGLID